MFGSMTELHSNASRSGCLLSNNDASETVPHPGLTLGLNRLLVNMSGYS